MLLKTALIGNLDTLWMQELIVFARQVVSEWVNRYNEYILIYYVRSPSNRSLNLQFSNACCLCLYEYVAFLILILLIL